MTLKQFLHIDVFPTTSSWKVIFNKKGVYKGKLMKCSDIYAIDPANVNTAQTLFDYPKGKSNLKVGQVCVSVVDLGDDNWLLTYIQTIDSKIDGYGEGDLTGGFNTTVLDKFSGYFGRVKFKFHRYCQNMGMFLDKIDADTEVTEYLPEPWTGESFPGFASVSLSYRRLKTIIDNNRSDWIVPLSASKAIYMIRDNESGKIYVGSAASDNEGLLSRWKSYVKNGHGGNVELKRIIEEKGFDYAKDNFEYSILEHHDDSTDRQHLIDRESYFKKILHSSTADGNLNRN